MKLIKKYNVMENYYKILEKWNKCKNRVSYEIGNLEKYNILTSTCNMVSTRKILEVIREIKNNHKKRK